MIAEVVRLLQSDEWRGVSKEVDIAKGKYKRVTTWREFIKQVRRL